MSTEEMLTGLTQEGGAGGWPAMLDHKSTIQHTDEELVSACQNLGAHIEMTGPLVPEDRAHLQKFLQKRTPEEEVEHLTIAEEMQEMKPQFAEITAKLDDIRTKQQAWDRLFQSLDKHQQAEHDFNRVWLLQNG